MNCDAPSYDMLVYPAKVRQPSTCVRLAALLIKTWYAPMDDNTYRQCARPSLCTTKWLCARLSSRMERVRHFEGVEQGRARYGSWTTVCHGPCPVAIGETRVHCPGVGSEVSQFSYM